MYSLIGFSRFTSRKTGKPFVQLFVTYEERNIDGVACDHFICSPDCISDDLYIGASLDISFNQRGFVTRVDVK